MYLRGVARLGDEKLENYPYNSYCKKEKNIEVYHNRSIRVRSQIEDTTLKYKMQILA